MKTALLIIDMQNDFVQPDAPLCVAGAQSSIPAIVRLATHARTKGWSVIHIIRQHDASGSDAELFRSPLFKDGKGFCVKGTRGAEIVTELHPQAGDYIVTKTRFSAFFQTDLPALLQRLEVKRIVLAGTQYPNCIRATAVDAMSLDYHVLLCTDACSAASAEVAAANIYDLKHMGIDCVPLKSILDERIMN